MKIGIRGGHTPFAKGAMGILDEQKEVRIWSQKVMEVLRAYGHTVIDCNTNARTSNDDLRQGVEKCNANNCDIFVSIHMNAFNGNAYGTETWCYNTNSNTAIGVGRRFCTNMNEIGYTNRGVKYNSNFYELKNTKCQAIILETLFCDNKGDTDRYKTNSWDTLAYLVANAIDSKIPKRKPQPTTPIPQPQPTHNCNNELIRIFVNGVRNMVLTGIDKSEKYARDNYVGDIRLECAKCNKTVKTFKVEKPKEEHNQCEKDKQDLQNKIKDLETKIAELEKINELNKIAQEKLNKIKDVLK